MNELRENVVNMAVKLALAETNKGTSYIDAVKTGLDEACAFFETNLEALREVGECA